MVSAGAGVTIGCWIVGSNSGILSVVLFLVSVGSLMTASQHGAVVFGRTIGNVVHIVVVRYIYITTTSIK